MSDPVPTTDDDTTPPEDDNVTTPTVERPRSHESVIGPDPDLIDRLEKITGAPLGYGQKDHDEHPIPASDRLDERRGEINEQAWLNSLTACDVMDLAGWRLDALLPDHHPKRMGDFARSLSGSPAVRNLVLAGTVGPGKTSAAIAVGWEALALGRSVRFIEHSKYLQWLRPDQTPPKPYDTVTDAQLRARMRASDVLILDDLGANQDPTVAVTPFVKEETLTLIGDRIDTPGKVTIVTTNRRSSELEVMFGEQFVSRLSKRGYALTFTGPDRRGRLSW